MPVCSICNRNKSRSEFNRKQIRKGKNPKCKQCNIKPYAIEYNNLSRIEMKKKLWIRCAKPPQSMKHLVKLNNHNFLSLSILTRSNKYHALIYNTINDKWTPSTDFKYLANTTSIKNTTVDYDNNEIYILVSRATLSPRILKYSFNQKCDKFVWIDGKSFKSLSQSNWECICSTVVDKRYHFLISTFPTRVWHYIHDFNKGKTLTKMLITPGVSFYWQNVIYFKQQNKLLLVCREGDVKTCSLNVRECKWEKSVEVQIPRNIRDMLPCRTLKKPYIFTGDERRMIVFYWSNRIDIINTENEVFEGHSDELYSPFGYSNPKFALLSKANMIDNGLIHGYFRRCWRYKNDGNVPILPLEIARLIDVMIGGDTFLHLFHEMKGKQIKINMKYILQKTMKVSQSSS